MKSIFAISAGRSRKSNRAQARKSRSSHRLAPTVNSLEDRVVLSTATTTFTLPIAQNNYAGTVDRIKFSLVNNDHPTWAVDYSSFTPLDLSITLNGGSDIDLSNGTPGQYKVGIVGSDTDPNSYWIVGLPRVALATGTYTIGFSSSSSITFYDPSDTSVTDTVTGADNSGTATWNIRSGTASGWGGTTSGVLSIPAGLTNVVDVAAGGNFSLALKADGTVVAWGSGTGATQLPATLTDASTARVAAISAGEAFALALKEDGTIVAWGTNGSYNVVNNAPTTGNYFSIGAGLNTAFAIGEYNGSTPLADSPGYDGSLVTWGQNTSQGEDLWVPDSGVLGIVQGSAGSDFIVGVAADSTLFMYGNVPASPPADALTATFLEAAAGVNPTNPTQEFAFALRSDHVAEGWGTNTNGQVTGVGTNAATQPSAGFNFNDISSIEAGSLHSVAQNYSNNGIRAWGFNGNPTDGRVNGSPSSSYIATASPSPTVGNASAGTIQTLVQVMDTVAPTITSFLAEAPTITSTFPLKYRITFSEPINLSTMPMTDFLVRGNSGADLSATFPVSSLALVSGSTYEVTVGTGLTPPVNFTDNPVKLQLTSAGLTIRDVAGNLIDPASVPSTSTTGITVATTPTLVSTNGTTFNSMQWVTPSSITYTMTFPYYASTSTSGNGAANPSRYTLTVTSGTLTGKQIQSITPVADPNAPAGFANVFTVTVSTGTPGTNAKGIFNLALTGVVDIYSGGTVTVPVAGSTVVVDNLIPSITDVYPSDSSGTAITGSGLNVQGTSANTVYFTATFADVVNFSGAAGLIGNYFAFTSQSGIVPSNVTAFISSVVAQNTTNAPVGAGTPPAFSDKWVVAISTSGAGTLGLTVKPSYTQSSTTYSIVNPVAATPPAQVSSSLYYNIRLVTSTNTVNGPTGLNPTNSVVWDYGAINTVQRSQVKYVQMVFSNPVAYTTGGVRALTPSDFKLYKYNSTTSQWTASTIPLVFDSAPSGGSGSYFSTYNIGFVNPDPDVLTWSIPDGFYQLTIDPDKYAGVGDDQDNYFTYGDSTAQAGTMFYRLYGNVIGYDPANGYAEVTTDDVFFFRQAYALTQPGQPDAAAEYAKWSMFSFYDGETEISTDDQFQMRLNIGKFLIQPTPRSFP